MPSICKVLSFYSSTRIKGKPMDISKYVTVTINDCRFIPFINRRGPVRTPIAISRGIYETLKSRGYKVILMASYNKSGKLVPTTQKVLGKNTVFSAINKSSNVNKPAEPQKEKVEEKKEEQKQETPPANEAASNSTKEEKKEEQKQETPANNKQEVQKPSIPAKEVEKKEADDEAKEEVKEEIKKEEKTNKSLKIFKNK